MARKNVKKIKKKNSSNFLLLCLINYVMSNGEKKKAEKIVIESINTASANCKKNAKEFLDTVVNNIKPRYEVKSRRIGGSTYQIPIEVRASRAITLALKWLVMYAKKRKSEKRMLSKLSAEMLDAFYKKGASVKRMEDTHKMAEANQAFAHYRW